MEGHVSATGLVPVVKKNYERAVERPGFPAPPLPRRGRGGERRQFIFHSTQPSVPAVVQATKAGAVNFLEKPAEKEVLQANIRHALELERQARARKAEHLALREKLELLTLKELLVLEGIAKGLTTRKIARDLRISPRTVEYRRAQMVKKLEFDSAVQLCQFAIRACDGPNREFIRRQLEHAG